MCGDLAGVAVADAAALDDGSLRDGLVELATEANRRYAQTLRLLAAFDDRGLPAEDGFRTTTAWLVAVLRMAPARAARLVDAARVLRQLPELSAATHAGQVPPEHVETVAALARRVGVARLVEGDALLAKAATVLEARQFRQVCQRVEAHLEPDGADPAEVFERRGLTLSPAGELTMIRGLLDPEGAATVQAALDALSPPPSAGEQRSAAQRRADALVELARLPLAAGDLPEVGGQRPQIGVMVWPQALSPETLAALTEAQADQEAAARLRELLDLTTTDAVTDATASPTAGPAAGATAGPAADATAGPAADAAAGATAGPTAGPAAGAASRRSTSAAGDQRLDEFPPWWERVGWADPPQLSWFGSIPPVVAQRLACDCDIFRVVMDPATSQPLDVGRAHRLVPYWMRRALYARDSGCRFPGCQAPAQWTDGHHLDEWVRHNGHTKVGRMILLCRFHHVLMHEGGWSIDLEPSTGQVQVTRPGGIPYRLPRGSPTGPVHTGPPAAPGTAAP